MIKHIYRNFTLSSYNKVVKRSKKSFPSYHHLPEDQEVVEQLWKKF